MDFKNTLTAYNEHVAQIEEAKKIMMNAPAEVFGKYYHDFDFGMAKDSVVTDYLEWKMKQGNLTFEVLKEKQTITVADFLKKRILRFTPPPTKRELDEVNLELVTYYLPHGYDLPEEFKNWCAQFSRFISWEDDILIIDYNTYGKYLFDCLSMLSREERLALFELDAMLMMIHEDMRKILKETLAYATEKGFPPYNKIRHDGLMRFLLVRRAEKTGEILVCLVTSSETDHDFEEWFEEVLYRYRSKTEKDMRHAQIPYREMYLLYGVLLVELKRIPEAQEALKKGLRWDPVCFRMMSEYIETYKMSGNIEQFFVLTKEAFKIAFRPTDLARCYRNLGYYFVEKKLWSEAIACNLLSLEYDKEAKAAQSELYYINNATNGEIPEPSIEQAEEYSKKYGFPMGPDRDILGLSYAYGKHFLEENEPNAARYFLSIIYGLTGEPDIKEIIEKLPQEE